MPTYTKTRIIPMTYTNIGISPQKRCTTTTGNFFSMDIYAVEQRVLVMYSTGRREEGGRARDEGRWRREGMTGIYLNV